MAIFKCKICGGSLEIDSSQSVATCEYCGTKQTLPKLDDERRANLYDRANHFRRNNDFDKAMGIYENILNEDNTDAEAYWSIVLCRYGIEYVEDPGTRRRVPTVNRAQFTSIFDDEDYKSAIANADGYRREIYEAEAAAINEIQKGILAISQKEEPFDVFVCYKETDRNGRRTQDSVLATELYHELTREGFKVFFSRITLEDKLGVAYEPYIFAALHSAKVMVVLGTRPEHFSAVWVKNEWSRYLALIKNGAKKTLIPAYRGMDPYDLPEEFSHLQAQDMSKLGFMQDLTRGIKKIMDADAPKTTVKETVVATAAAFNVTPLLKRAFMFLEDGDFDRADDFCEQVLNQDPENAQAYLGKLMVELRLKRQNDLTNQAEPFDDNKNYQKAVRFADSTLAAELRSYIAAINERKARIAEEKRKEALYSGAMDDYKSAEVYRIQNAIKVFTSLAGYKDSDERIRLCQAKIDQIHIKEENDRIERERLAEEKRIADEKARLEKQHQAEIDRKVVMIATSIVVAVFAFIIVINNVIIPSSDYNLAMGFMNAGKYEDAISAFEALDGYWDSEEKIAQCNTAILDGKYENAIALMNAGKYEDAISAFKALSGHKDSEDKIAQCNTAILDGKYDDAIALMNAGKYEKAISAFEALDGYRDSEDKIAQCNAAILDGKYDDAIALMNAGKYEDAISAFKALSGHKDSEEKISQCNTAILDGKYDDAIALMNAGEYEDAISAFEALDGYKESANKITECMDAIYAVAEDLVTGGEFAHAAMCFGKIGDYKDAAERSFALWSKIAVRESIVVGYYYVAGLKFDGTVVAVGSNSYGRCDVSGWTDIVAISAGSFHTVGLKSDGTVVAVGDNDYGRCDVSGWTDIVAISAGYRHTVGLKSDGTVVAVGLNKDGQCDVSGWTDIVAISAEDYHTVGLKSDGTVVAVGLNEDGQCDVSGWTDIVAISAGCHHTVGLKSDGTVVAVGSNDSGQCDVSGWADIVAISAGDFCTVGLKSDGTVVAVGSNWRGQINVSDWTDIVAISVGSTHTIGLKSDGTVVAAGDNDYGRCDVSDWSDIKVP